MINIKTDKIKASNHAGAKYLQMFNDCDKRGLELLYHIVNEFRELDVKKIKQEDDGVLHIHTSYNRVYKLANVDGAWLIITIEISAKNPKGNIKKKYRGKLK